ncbi:MAG: DUF374 domain-containing protein [Candidatus Kapabacteria bacterium]|nr:DUF374 domain-containing protein [Ignavibacteriota bacterium]MCW5885489.1 DUF374 domain-containing protein [Candidatus Kapabacteria bacterium]
MLNLLSNTWRIKVQGYDENISKGIVVFWHGLMLPAWKYFTKYNPTAVVSLSKDGEILSGLLSKWGFSLIRGSSSRKGKEVLDEIINSCNHSLVLMTPDGPQGPRFEMKAGAVVAASRAQVPIYLCGIDIKSKHIFEKSWDKFELPLPFSEILLTISKPEIIEKSDDKDLISLKISELQSNLLLLHSNNLTKDKKYD